MARRLGFAMVAVMTCVVLLERLPLMAGEYNIPPTSAVSNMTRITSRPEPEFAPSACPATGEVAFVGMVCKEKGRRDHFEVWVIDPAKSQHQYRRITDSEADSLHPAISPDGKKIAFESQRGAKSAIWETSANGLGGNRLISEGEEMSFTYPDITTDGFVYCALTSKPFLPPFHPVELDDIGRGAMTCILTPPYLVAAAGEFVISNCIMGQPIVDTDLLKGKISRYGYLWICDYDGLNPTEFVEGYTPRWYPRTATAKADKILFSKRDADGVWHIWTVNRDGANLTQVTWGKRSDIQPCWSPDGTKIAFASNRSAGNLSVLMGDNNYNIWIMNADGTGMTQLTNSKNFCGHPTFTTNDEIYFHACGGFLIPNWDIWRLTLTK
jgi:dipeptidyl aminopeptidase/acylaminoacyl peptidase